MFCLLGKKKSTRRLSLSTRRLQQKIRDSSPIYFSGRRIMVLKLQSCRQRIFYKEIGALSHINSSVSLL